MNSLIPPPDVFNLADRHFQPIANIARLLDGGATEDGRPYFVIGYIEGRLREEGAWVSPEYGSPAAAARKIMEVDAAIEKRGSKGKG
jgi:hypothetical protein